MKTTLLQQLHVCGWDNFACNNRKNRKNMPFSSRRVAFKSAFLFITIANAVPTILETLVGTLPCPNDNDDQKEHDTDNSTKTLYPMEAMVTVLSSCLTIVK
jgi:hypothetical protein